MFPKMNTLFATKKYMSQVFTQDGVRLPVTVLSSGAHLVTQSKTQDNNGYWAVQFGFGTRRIKNLKKPVIGHLKGALKDDKKAPRFLREVRTKNEENFEVGQSVNPAEVLAIGDIVNVTATSKGKGFAGVVKRHKFSGGPKTHGQSDRHRAPGSIGQGTTPGRVYKGKKMAGRMGAEQGTVRNLIVLSLNQDSGEIRVSGPVPGSVGSLVRITKVGTSKKKYELVGQQESDVSNISDSVTPEEESMEISSEEPTTDQQTPETGNPEPENATEENNGSKS